MDNIINGGEQGKHPVEKKSLKFILENLLWIGPLALLITYIWFVGADWGYLRYINTGPEVLSQTVACEFYSIYLAALGTFFYFHLRDYKEAMDLDNEILSLEVID